MDKSNCRLCNQPILWVQSWLRIPIPLDPEPTEERDRPVYAIVGNLAYALSGIHYRDYFSGPLYRAHACPKAPKVEE